MSVEADFPAIYGPEAGSGAPGPLSCPLGGSLQLEFFEGGVYDDRAGLRWVPHIVTVWAKPEFL